MSDKFSDNPYELEEQPIYTEKEMEEYANKQVREFAEWLADNIRLDCFECEFATTCKDDCIDKLIAEWEKTETWHSVHGNITVPKGTFDKIYNSAQEDDDDF